MEVSLGSRLSLRAGMGDKAARSREKKKEERERKEIKAGVAIDLYAFFPAGPFEVPSLPDFSWGEPGRLGTPSPQHPLLIF